MGTGIIMSADEDMDGWDELIAQLSLLPDFDKDWYEKVAQPPFDASNYVAFEAGA